MGKGIHESIFTSSFLLHSLRQEDMPHSGKSVRVGNDDVKRIQRY